MIALSINRSWQQLLHPKFRSVFLTAIAAAAATLVMLTFVLNAYWPEVIVFESEWFSWLNDIGEGLADAGFWAVVFAGSYLLFPGIVTMVMGILADQIATAVEEEYYPNRRGTRQVPVGDVVISAAKLTLMMIFINLLAAFPYLLLLFFTAGTGTLALFVVINGYLLGREYFEMVAIRHANPRLVNELRVTHGSKVFVVGALMAAMFLVPILNILAPILGAAIMTHMVHQLGVPDEVVRRGGEN